MLQGLHAARPVLELFAREAVLARLAPALQSRAATPLRRATGRCELGSVAV